MSNTLAKPKAWELPSPKYERAEGPQVLEIWTFPACPP
jgi:hypothetical protein